MTTPKVNLKPYRVALEALITHNTPVKISGMLGSAAANVENPELRVVLKSYINQLDNYVVGPTSRTSIRLERMGYVFDGVKGVSWSILNSRSIVSRQSSSSAPTTILSTKALI